MIRVIRVLEYRYADAEVMASDMERWAVGAGGSFRPHSRITVASATTLPEFVADSAEAAE